MKKIIAMLLAMIPAAVAEETPEPWTVTVFRGDPGDQPTDDNKIYKMIEEQFGIKFEFEFLAGNLDETLGLKIADEVYPDLFDGGNSAETLENAGVLWQTATLGKVDQGGGGTVAAYMANRNIVTVDAGVPVLCMHAPMELVSKLDCYMTMLACKAIYLA